MVLDLLPPRPRHQQGTPRFLPLLFAEILVDSSHFPSQSPFFNLQENLNI